MWLLRLLKSKMWGEVTRQLVREFCYTKGVSRCHPATEVTNANSWNCGKELRNLVMHIEEFTVRRLVMSKFNCTSKE